jgi:hypothetical protein
MGEREMCILKSNNYRDYKKTHVIEVITHIYTFAMRKFSADKM